MSIVKAGTMIASAATESRPKAQIDDLLRGFLVNVNLEVGFFDLFSELLVRFVEFLIGLGECFNRQLNLVEPGFYLVKSVGLCCCHDSILVPVYKILFGDLVE